MRFGKRGRRRLLLFQILDALVRSSQLLLEQADLLQGLLALLFSGRNAFVCCHGARLSDKGLSEQFRTSPLSVQKTFQQNRSTRTANSVSSFQTRLC